MYTCIHLYIITSISTYTIHIDICLYAQTHTSILTYTPTDI